MPVASLLEDASASFQTIDPWKPHVHEHQIRSN